MKLVAAALLALRALAQSPPASVPELATRMAQLMESTAVAVPGLTNASATLTRNAASDAASLQKTPADPSLLYRFVNEAKAYLALSESFPRPAQFPETADRQYDELRGGLAHMQRDFEALLQNQNLGAQAREADPAQLKRYAEANGKLAPAGKLPRVVFFGDSITDFWRLNEYFTGRDFINRGISGQTTLQMLGRFLDDVVALHPKAVLILAGVNDIGHDIAAGAIEHNLASMGDLAKAHGIKPLFASILPVARPAPEIQAVNRWLKDYCRTEGFTYVDYYSAMADSSGALQPDLSDDGLHPNAKGYRVMSPIALEATGRVLSAADQNAPADQQVKRRFRILGK